MSVHTRSQRLAQAAYARIANGIPSKEFASFAKMFPALIHTCGLAQAVAFAKAKKRTDYIDDLTQVLWAAGHVELTEQEPLDHHTRQQPVIGYLRLSCDALDAASWLKRYVEAKTEEA